MKTKVFNLIILDESGSMNFVRKQTINGCNETINTIISAQKKFAESQEHYISIYAFQSDGEVPSRYIVKNIPASEARHISEKDYCPCGCTPLYDAVGATLSDLKITAYDEKNSIASVTIITDGEENSSIHYSLKKVADMIKQLKELGWNFNFIGANIDVKAAAQRLNIDSSLEFTHDENGTAEMFANENKSRVRYYNRMAEALGETDEHERAEKIKKASRDYFND